MPTVLTGLVDTEDVLADERKPDMDEILAMLDPDESQFTTMLRKISKGEAVREKVLWMEDEYMPRLTALAASAASADTALTVTTGEGAYVRAGDVIRNTVAGDAYYVTAVSTDTLTVVRGIGGVTAATSASGAQLIIVSNASKQGGTLGVRKMLKKTLGFNYTQIHRHPFGFTNTNVAIARYGPDEPAREAAKKMVEHQRGLEQTLFWGARHFATIGANSEPTGFTGGLIEFISTNKYDVNGTLDAAKLDTFMTSVLSKGNKNKVFFVSPVIAGAISKLLRDAWSPASVSDRLWGAKVDGYLSGTFGYEIPVIVKRDWVDFSTASKQYGGRGFLVDMANVQYKTLTGRSTRLLRNRQANDADETTHEWLTESTLLVKQEKTHGMMYGVT